MDFAPHLVQIFALRGASASYAPVSGPALPCRAVRQGGGQPVMVGPVRVIVDRTCFHVLRADVPAPAAGGTLTVSLPGGGSDVFTIEGVQPVERDAEGLLWQLEAKWGAAIGYRSVAGAGAAQSPPQGAGFKVAAAQSAGASTVSIGAGFIAGTLVAGDKFTIAGDATVYTVSADAAAAGNRFADVPFAPALAADAAQNAAVAFDFARDYAVRAAVAAYAANEFQGGVQIGDRRLVVFQAALAAAGMTDVPKAGDRATFEGRSFTVVSATALYQGSASAAWDLQVRA